MLTSQVVWMQACFTLPENLRRELASNWRKRQCATELDRLQQELVDGQELEKVKNKFESTQIFGNINYLNVATNLAWFELLGKAEDLEKEVERYRSVTAMQLREVAQSAFRKENGVVLYYKSK